MPETVLIRGLKLSWCTNELAMLLSLLLPIGQIAGPFPKGWNLTNIVLSC